MTNTFVSTDGATRVKGGADGIQGEGGRYAVPKQRENVMPERVTPDVPPIAVVSRLRGLTAQHQAVVDRLQYSAALFPTVAWAADAVRHELKEADCMVFSSHNGILTLHAYYGVDDENVQLSPGLEKVVVDEFKKAKLSANLIAHYLPDGINAKEGVNTVMIPLRQVDAHRDNPSVPAVPAGELEQAARIARAQEAASAILSLSEVDLPSGASQVRFRTDGGHTHRSCQVLDGSGTEIIVNDYTRMALEQALSQSSTMGYRVLAGYDVENDLLADYSAGGSDGFDTVTVELG